MKQIVIGFVLGVCACLMVWSFSGKEVQARPAAAGDQGGVASGPCGCVGDFDSNGVVNVFDLLTLLAAWGPCAPVPPGCCESECDCGPNEDCCGGQCLAVGMPCSTGMIGACQAGTVQCVNGAAECVGPGPQPEQCNGIDDDCNGVVDDGAACPLGESCCNAQCVNLGTDPNNCGACNVSCGSGRICSAGLCTTAQCTNNAQCDDGNGCTINLCVSNQCVTQFAAAGTACNDGDPCTFSDTCDGTGNCIGQPVNCGPNSFCSGGSCLCNAGFADCNANPGDGCEVHLQSNVDHCGACGNVCPNRPNATRTCVSSICGFVCNPGFADCNGNSVDGCEVNLNTNSSHCGTCGNQCPVGMICSSSTCVVP